MSREPLRDRVQGTGPLTRLRGVVDRSIAMYVFRELTGHASTFSDDRPSPPMLDADEIAYRIGAATERPHPSVVHTLPVPAVAVPAQPSFSRAQRPASRPPITAPDVVRRRLLRDSGIALAGFAAVAFLAVAVLPPAQGGVLGATGRPGDQELSASSPTPSLRPS